MVVCKLFDQVISYQFEMKLFRFFVWMFLVVCGWLFCESLGRKDGAFLVC